MKIVLATGIFPPDIGGPATYTERLAAELSRRGFDVKVITYSDGGEKAKTYNFQVKKISRKYPPGLRHFVYFLYLLKLAKDCDKIFVQNLTSAGFPVFLAAKLLRKKYVLKVVGNAAWEQKKGYLRKIQEYVARGAYLMITPSHYVKKMAAGWGVPEHKIEVIYNAPEAAPQSDVSKEEAKREIGIEGDIVLSAGRLAPWKGFADLVAVMPDLLKESPGFRLVIVGEGKERNNLESQIHNLGLKDKVKLAGGVAHSRMSLYFKAADVFILNSGYEGLSHVILEAMQLGTPVIASDQSGNPELIENNFNGFLVEYGNQKEIKEAVLNLWRDKDLREKFIQNSKEKLKGFTWENLTEKTIRILGDL